MHLPPAPAATPLPPVDLAHVLALAGPDLRSLDGARLFLTGGTGFFGRWLVATWVAAQRELGLHGELHVLSRAPRTGTHPGLHFLEGEQTGFPFPAGSFDGIIHGAVDQATPEVTFWGNLQGCRRVLALAGASGARRFLLTSSGAAYGPQPAGLDRIPETHLGTPDPLDPRQAYGLAKRACEALCATFPWGPRAGFVVARGFAFHGPGLPLDRNLAMGNFLRDALGTGPICLQGDGTPRRSYLYAADLAVHLWALFVRGRSGQAYNLGSEEDLSILELAERVRDLVAPGRELRVAATLRPGTAISRYVPSTRKAEEELGLKPIVGLDEGIRRTAAWHRAQA